MIFSNWNILGNIHLRQFDNKTSSFEVTGDIPELWNWQLLFTCQDNINIVDMIQDGNRLYVLLTDDILSLNGAYYFQMKATQGELVKHTNIVKIYVSRSISGDATWPIIPTEFTDLEKAVKSYAESAKESADKAESAAVHSPVIGSNGNWFIWDFNKQEYVDTDVSASGGGGKNEWEKLVDTSLAESVESVTYTFDNCKRIKALIAPVIDSGEYVSGWKRFTINNVSYPSLNSSIHSYEGICLRIDSEYPPYIQANANTNTKLSVNGLVGGVYTAALENIAPNGITEFGCQTAGILKAGTKIEIWGVKS